MNELDVNKQLSYIVKAADYFWTTLFILVSGTFFLAWYKRRKGQNYKIVIILGIGVIFFFLLASAFVASFLINPIYNLGS